MTIVAAFMDDSGGTDPNSGPVFALGFVVVDSADLRGWSAAWLDALTKHLSVAQRYLALSSLEAKSSDLYDMKRRLESGQPLPLPLQKALFHAGLNTPTRVDDLITDLWRVLANHPAPARYVGSVAFKHPVWQQFRSKEYEQWQKAPSAAPKSTVKALRQFIGEKTFEFALQRLQYVGDDRSFRFDDAVLVGDEGALNALMYASQAEAQAGLGQFTTLPKLLNNVWFGSSLHNPCLQMADWVAFACRRWAEGKTPEGVAPLGYIIHRFRGYSNNRVRGVGIAVNPSKADVPALPKQMQI